MRAVLVWLFCLALLTGCSTIQRPPEPAVLSQEAPPWAAPRDAISYIQAAGLAELPLDEDSDPWIVGLVVIVAGEEVEIPAYIGVDRVRALQAPVHTHEVGGEVWLEGEGNREVTLGQFFTLWGVRFDETCLGASCGSLRVTVDGEVIANPQDFVLRGAKQITVEVD